MQGYYMKSSMGIDLGKRILEEVDDWVIYSWLRTCRCWTMQDVIKQLVLDIRIPPRICYLI